MGKVVLVGAGPGDPDLLTLKALRLIQAADVVVYDSLVSKEVLSYTKPSCTHCFVGKRKNRHKATQSQICQLLLNYGHHHALVVRLKGGDPMIFGRATEELEALQQAGIECSVVPGVTAASGAAASFGLALTQRQKANAITYLTEHNSQGLLDIDWVTLANDQQHFVIYMGLSLLEEIVAGLLARGKDPLTPFSIISNVSLASELMVSGTLRNIIERSARYDLSSPAVLVMGPKPSLGVNGCQSFTEKASKNSYLESLSAQAR